MYNIFILTFGMTFFRRHGLKFLEENCQKCGMIQLELFLNINLILIDAK